MNDILLILVGTTSILTFINLLDEYGSTTLDKVKTYQENFTLMHSREAQNAFYMDAVITASLTQKVHTQLIVDLHQAKIRGI